MCIDAIKLAGKCFLFRAYKISVVGIFGSVTEIQDSIDAMGQMDAKMHCIVNSTWWAVGKYSRDDLFDCLLSRDLFHYLNQQWQCRHLSLRPLSIKDSNLTHDVRTDRCWGPDDLIHWNTPPESSRSFESLLQSSYRDLLMTICDFRYSHCNFIPGWDILLSSERFLDRLRATYLRYSQLLINMCLWFQENTEHSASVGHDQSTAWQFQSVMSPLSSYRVPLIYTRRLTY